MRLKLMAPFAVDGFRLTASRVIESPDGYARAWAEAGRLLSEGAGVVAGIDEGAVDSMRLTHAPEFTRAPGSRYRTIHTHSLQRPLHLFEVVVRLGSEELVGETRARRSEAGRAARDDVAAAVVSALEDALVATGPGALVRVYDHGVAQLEMDLTLPADLSGLAPGAGIGEVLDTLQDWAIDLAEVSVDEVCERVLDPFAAWLEPQEELSRYLRRRDVEDPLRRQHMASRTLWVTRSLVLEDEEPDPGVRRVVAEHWLADASGAEDVVERCATEPGASCMSWLNYFFGEDSYPGRYPRDGWGFEDGKATPFSREWAAMLIAQYYYAAFDLQQSDISRMLSIAFAGEGPWTYDEVEALLDGEIRDANMLKLEYEENRKYYARYVGGLVDEILAGWDFRSGVYQQIDDRLKDCESRLRELHARSQERNSAYTDVILLAIGVVSILNVFLYLAEYGRTMTSDADLSVYDWSSRWNVADWLGGSTTDAILASGTAIAVGLVLLYAFFRSKKPRM